jgi:hypothetical protein
MLGKKSLRSVIKPAGKADPIKVRLKLPKRLSLHFQASDFQVSTAPKRPKCGKRRTKEQISSAR